MHLETCDTKGHLACWPLHLHLRLLFCWLVIGGSGSGSVMASPQINLEEVRSGELLFVETTNQHQRYTPAVLLNTHYQVNVTGLICQTQLTQRFENTSPLWKEAIYVFPLPENAAVYRMELHINERFLVAEIKEKQQAEKIYQQARQSGKLAAVVHQQRANLFRHKIANIPPGAQVRIRLFFQQTVDYENERFALALPLTLTPRYLPGGVLKQADVERIQDRLAQLTSEPPSINPLGWGSKTSQVPDGDKITPFTIPGKRLSEQTHNTSVSIRISDALPLASIKSSSHSISTHQVAGAYEVSLQQNDVKMDRDFVLEWQPEPALAPTAALFTEEVGKDTYGQLLLLPPHLQDTRLTLPREQIWVVDTSGSMGGVSITQARQALQNALSTLTAQDRFNVVEFNSEARALFNASVGVTPATLQQAHSFVAGLQANGGTEISKALDLAFSQPVSNGYLRQIIFITDGSVGNERALFEQIHAQLGESRLFTVGIGPAPNRLFMRKAAQFGRGSFTHINGVQEVQEKMSAMAEKLRYPAMRDVNVKIKSAVFSQLQAEQYPRQAPDLYYGEPLVLYFKLNTAQWRSGLLQAKGYSLGQMSHQQALWQQQMDLNNSAQGKGIARAWARQKIDHWLDKKALGESESAIKSAVLPLALEFQLMSPYTSFVAVDKTPIRPRSEQLSQSDLATLLPKGMSQNMASLPATATLSGWLMNLGMALLIISLMLRVFKRG